MKKMKVARFGDNMRNVAVTEGDKIDAQIRFNIDVNGFGISKLSCLLYTSDAADE